MAMEVRPVHGCERSLRRCKGWRVLWSVVALAAPFHFAYGDVPVPWTSSSTFQNRAETAVFGKPPRSIALVEPVAVSQEGDEPASCAHMLIRRSTAAARAEGKTLEPAAADAGPRAVQLTAYAKATGGGYRTCDACVFTCIGLHPHDTDGVATASSGALTTIVPEPSNAKVLELVVYRSVTGRGVLKTVIEDPEGRQLGEIKDDIGRIAVRAQEASKLIVRNILTASASDRGTCCDSAADTSAHLRFELNAVGEDKANEHRATEPVPYVIGGKLETGYPQVGFVWVAGGTDLCTGTVVGPTTVLTAAHCVDGLTGVAIEFKLANSVTAAIASADTYNVAAFELPTDATTGPAYDRLIVADDIALLHLDRAVTDPSDPAHARALDPIAIHRGSPAISGFGSQKLLFIGYGYADVITGPVLDPSKSGTKRSVLMPISDSSRKTFRNQATGQNTCRGDSGGPALLLGQAGGPQIVGIVSAGDRYCKDFANNTRMDAYLTWLSGKVK